MVARWLREKPARVGSARPGSVLAPTQGSYHSTGAPDVPCGTPVGLEEPIDVPIPSHLLTPANVIVGLQRGADDVDPLAGNRAANAVQLGAAGRRHPSLKAGQTGKSPRLIRAGRRAL